MANEYKGHSRVSEKDIFVDPFGRVPIKTDRVLCYNDKFNCRF